MGGPPGYLELSQALVQSACWKAREVDRETVLEDIKRVAEEELSPGRLRKQRAFSPDEKIITFVMKYASVIIYRCT